jgi:hypothetical protein
MHLKLETRWRIRARPIKNVYIGGGLSHIEPVLAVFAGEKHQHFSIVDVSLEDNLALYEIVEDAPRVLACVVRPHPPTMQA